MAHPYHTTPRPMPLAEDAGCVCVGGGPSASIGPTGPSVHERDVPSSLRLNGVTVSALTLPGLLGRFQVSHY